MINVVEKISNQTSESLEVAPSEKTVAKVVNVSAGKKFTAKICKNFNVYLINGEIVLKRRGMVDFIVKGKGEWNINNSLFNEDDRDSYVRCESDCEFLLLPLDKSKNSNLNSMAEKPKKSHFANHSKTTDINSSSDAIEISIHDLDKPYEDTVIISPEESEGIKKNIYLNASLKSDINEQEALNKSSLMMFIKNKFKKGDVLKKNITRLINEKLPDAIDNIATNIDNSINIVPATINEHPNIHGSFDFIGQWNSVKAELPAKSGLYYISNSKDVDVTYFNKDRGIFHSAENLETLFWSSKKVILK